MVPISAECGVPMVGAPGDRRSGTPPLRRANLVDVEARVIQALWDCVVAGSRGANDAPLRALEEKLIRQRFVTAAEFEDLLLIAGVRWRPYETPLAPLLEQFQLQEQSAFFPPSRGGNAHGFGALALADAVALLAELEGLGVATQPERLARVVRDAVSTPGAMMSWAEVRCVLYERERGKGPPVEILARPETGAGVASTDEHRTANGYRVVLDRDEQGVALALTVHAPRYRRRRPPVEVTCEACGYTYKRGDMDSSDGHRREHRRRMPYLDPAPLDPVLEMRDRAVDLAIVNALSPLWMHREMVGRARALNRELQYSVRWGLPETDQKARGHFLILPDGRIAGACSFRWREFVTPQRPGRWNGSGSHRNFGAWVCLRKSGLTCASYMATSSWKDRYRRRCRRFCASAEMSR